MDEYIEGLLVDFLRYYASLKYIFLVLIALMMMFMGQRYMAGHQALLLAADVDWVAHDTDIVVDRDSPLWLKGHRVNLGLTRQQLTFKLQLRDSFDAPFLVLSPAYLDTVEVEFFNSQGALLSVQIKGDKVTASEVNYNFDIGQLVFDVPATAKFGRVNILSTEAMQASIRLSTYNELFEKYSLGLVFKGIVLFIVLCAAVMALVASVRMKQALLFVFGLHQLVWLTLLVLTANLMPSIWPHLNVMNGNLQGVFTIAVVISGACFHWLLLRNMVVFKWLPIVIIGTIIISLINLVVYIWLDQKIALMSSVIVTAMLAFGLLIFIPRRSPKDKIQGLIFKKISGLYGFFMFLGAVGALSRLGFGQGANITVIYFYALVTVAIMVGMIRLQSNILRRRALSMAFEARRLSISNDRLSRDLAEQTALLSMLSHEIKTPLTTLNFSVTGAPQQKIIDAQLANIQHVIDKVELMSRLDSDFNGREPVCLVQLVQAQWAVSADAGHQSQRLKVTCRGDISFVGNKLALKVIVNDLLANARKYACHEVIQVSLMACSNGVAIRFKNGCKKLPQASMPALTDKYYRAANVGGVRGTGLGLWIVQNLCVANYYALSLKLVGGVFVATVRLPR